jgi:hypothetical protein
MCGNKGKYRAQQKKYFHAETLNICLKWMYLQMEIFPRECVLIFYLFVITQHIIRIMNDNIVTITRLQAS